MKTTKLELQLELQIKELQEVISNTITHLKSIEGSSKTAKILHSNLLCKQMEFKRTLELIKELETESIHKKNEAEIARLSQLLGKKVTLEYFSGVESATLMSIGYDIEDSTFNTLVANVYCEIYDSAPRILKVSRLSIIGPVAE